METQQTPVVTKAEFDSLRLRLRADLERWWDDEREGLAADPPPSDPATDALWEGLPEIDSKSVVKASPIIREHLGIDLDLKLIRKGGYESFEDLVNDLLPKLRDACPDRHASTALVPNHEGAAK